ncbi:hypothetical protein [Paraburkholderia sp. BL10I2N1]|uniref:hypothetical protein n=1 Tax=Paraburkholderia sp. BL10I2N1 TaxID=1938796 RepID=UPI0010D91F24|nr:hypothetical protein [Paraburkholderia sp. BL10I2N1]TDN67096.1 hypothetical protein B0G77_0323 [Paraburkholderia sp. BL10I2N1]
MTACQSHTCDLRSTVGKAAFQGGVPIVVALSESSFFRSPSTLACAASKDELIAAFLDWRHDFWIRWFVETVEARFAERAGLSAIADALGEWFAQEDYRGCSFINVVVEAGSTGDPGHLQQAVSHKQAVEQFIAGLASRLGLQSPAPVAAEAMLCVEGMIVRYQMTHDATVVESGRRVLARIEEAATAGRRKVKVAERQSGRRPFPIFPLSLTTRVATVPDRLAAVKLTRLSWQDPLIVVPHRMIRLPSYPQVILSSPLN